MSADREDTVRLGLLFLAIVLLALIAALSESSGRAPALAPRQGSR